MSPESQYYLIPYRDFFSHFWSLNPGASHLPQVPWQCLSKLPRPFGNATLIVVKLVRHDLHGPWKL